MKLTVNTSDKKINVCIKTLPVTLNTKNKKLYLDTDFPGFGYKLDFNFQ
jgi:hypothetical protein